MPTSTTIASERRPVRMPRPRPFRLAVAALATAGLAAGCVACSAASPPVTDTLSAAVGHTETISRVAPVARLDSVGRIDGSTALIAVLARDGVVSVYLCDGPSGIAERFSGRVSDGHADLVAPDGTRLSIDLDGTSSHGLVTLPGARTATFRTAATSRPEAGWFHTVGVDGRPAGTEASWIELDDGTQNGLCLGTCPPPGGDDGTGNGGHHHGGKHHGHHHGGKHHGHHHGGKHHGHHHGKKGGTSHGKNGGTSHGKNGGTSHARQQDTGWGEGAWGRGSAAHGRSAPRLHHLVALADGGRDAVVADADLGTGRVVGVSRVRV